MSYFEFEKKQNVFVLLHNRDLAKLSKSSEFEMRDKKAQFINKSRLGHGKPIFCL